MFHPRFLIVRKKSGQILDVPQQQAKGRALLEGAAAAGHPLAEGECLENKWRTPGPEYAGVADAHLHNAFHCVLRALARDPSDPFAQFQMGIISSLSFASKPANTQVALDWFCQAARQGHWGGAREVCVMLLSGTMHPSGSPFAREFPASGAVDLLFVRGSLSLALSWILCNQKHGETGDGTARLSGCYHVAGQPPVRGPDSCQSESRSRSTAHRSACSAQHIRTGI
jgi:hypothetical protein